MRRGLPTAVARRLDPAERYGLRLTLAALAFVLVAVPFATLLYQVLAKGSLTRVDGDVADSMNRFVHERRGWIGVLEVVTALGTTLVLTTVVLAATLWAWRRGARRLCAYLVTTSIGGVVVSTTIKLLVARPRPVVDHPIIEAFGKSFPSGHALSSTVVYGAVLLAFLPVLRPGYRRVAVVATVVLALAVGASRVLLGVHFVSDVIAGHVLGLAWLALSTAVFAIWRVERGRRPTDAIADGVEPEEARALAGR